MSRGSRGRRGGEGRRAGTERFEGTIVEVHGIRATVLEHGTAERIRCRPLRDRTQLAVGDRVVVEAGRHGTECVAIEERRRCLWRPIERGRRLMAVHVDRLIVVTSVVPEPKPGLVDRFLVAADAGEIEALVVLNKIDLGAESIERARAALAPFARLGYPVLEVSAHTGAGMGALEEIVQGGLSVLCGHSGVGKSSLLNRLEPGAALPVGGLNEITGKGRHTTSVTTCHERGAAWPEGALLVDTPGIRAFGLYGYELVEIAQGFRDLAPFRTDCRFRDCLHESEPDCAVRAAAERGDVEPTRYEGYLRILESLREGAG